MKKLLRASDKPEGPKAVTVLVFSHDLLFNIVLFQPRIPNNTGVIGRTCSLSGGLPLLGSESRDPQRGFARCCRRAARTLRR